MPNKEVQAYFDFVLPLVKAVGKIIVEAKDYKIETKEQDYDIVTYYDRKVEEVLIAEIKKRFPNHKFIGEEESSDNGRISQLTNDPTWIIDPIDGTANFVRRCPITCISIGLAINKDLVGGIIYNAFMKELYTAIKGQGAFLNGQRIYTSRETDIKKSVMNYELSLAKAEKLRDMYLYRFARLIPIIMGIRAYGCAALGLCYVARGATDAYQCDGLYPWDVAAGAVIVKEAGGHLCGTGDKEFDLMNPNFLATATEELANQYLDIEREADAERLANMRIKKE